jgi:hypothetical protein
MIRSKGKGSQHALATDLGTVRPFTESIAPPEEGEGVGASELRSQVARLIKSEEERRAEARALASQQAALAAQLDLILALIKSPGCWSSSPA